jgi:hypothetical protein
MADIVLPEDLAFEPWAVVLTQLCIAPDPPVHVHLYVKCFVYDGGLWVLVTDLLDVWYCHQDRACLLLQHTVRLPLLSVFLLL